MRLRLLGPFELRSDLGQSMPVGAPKRRTLLTALALELNQVVPLPRLIELVWDGSPPSTARAGIHVQVSALRKLLGRSTELVTRRPGYCLLAGPDTVDLHQARSLVTTAATIRDDATAVAVLRSALTLWRGPALDGVPGDLLRARVLPKLESERDAALEALAGRLLALGRSCEVLDDLVETLDRNPLRESTVRVLMCGLYQNGRVAQALAAFEAMRDRLVEQLGVDPSERLRNLYEGIRAGLPVDVAGEPGSAPERPAVRHVRTPRARPGRTPFQLPGGPSKFVGRETELARLDRDYRRRAADVHAIVGPGGVGKTAVGLRWTHLVGDDFPDGHLFVDLQGFDESEPLRPHVVLARFLRCLGVPEAGIPDDTPARAALFRSTVAARRMLVVLDNARSVEQVVPLLPDTPNCATVVTSRSLLTGLADHATVAVLAVGRLPAEMSVALLAAVVGDRRVADDRPAAEALVALCDHLPLAIRVAAARLLGSPLMTVSELVGELSGEHSVLEGLVTDDLDVSVAASLRLSHRLLSPDAARLLAHLGLFPGLELDDHTAAALGGQSVRVAGGALAELVSAHLLTQPRPHRYGWHDLVRVFTRQLADTELTAATRATAMRRLLDYYLHVTATVRAVTSQFLEPQQPLLHMPRSCPTLVTAADGLRWFDDEAQTVEKLIAVAATGGLPEHSWRLLDNADQLCRFNGNVTLWVRSARIALDAVRVTGNRTGEMLLVARLGYAEHKAGDPARGIELLRAAIGLADEIGTPDHRFSFLHDLAECLEESGRWPECVDTLRLCLDIATECGDVRHECVVHNTLAWVNVKRGAVEEALPAARAAVRLAKRSGGALHGAAMHTYATVLKCLGRWQEALDCCHEALAESTVLGARFHRANCLLTIGEILVHLGRPEEGRTCLSQARDMFVELGRPEAAEAGAHLAALPDLG